MSPTLLSLVCPNCGGMLELTTRADLFKCAHCRHLALLRWPDASATAPLVERLVEKQSWKANLLRPGSTLNWQGGDLRLTDREIAFVPHAVNFGAIERAILPLASIASHTLAKGLFSDELTLTDDRGEAWGVRVFRGAETLAAIEKARAAMR